MYDLLIKGGKVIDPAQGIEDYLDVAVSGGKIAAVAKDISSQESQQVVDARNKIVAPGLIDLHCHVYDGTFKSGIPPDVGGVRQGVTTVVDGGSAGQAIFGGFPKYIIPSCRTTVYCFLNLASQGLTITPELRDRVELDCDAIEAVIKSNRDIIKGIKLRLVSKFIASNGDEIIKLARELAAKFGLHIMVHIGSLDKQVPAALTQQCLRLMEAGDIMSHMYTSHQGGLMSDGKVLPEVREAMGRGVILDVGHGRSNLNYDVARKMMAQGILPTTISSDLSNTSLKGPVYGLTVTMSKFMALGLDLKQVIQMTTINPARAIGIDNRKGSLKPGMDADVSILELSPGKWQLVDSVQQKMEAATLIEPRITVKSGQVIPAAPVAKP